MHQGGQGPPAERGLLHVVVANDVPALLLNPEFNDNVAYLLSL